FMGGELGQWIEWNVGAALDWTLLDYPAHRGVQTWVRALNRLYRDEPSLHRLDFREEGFEWLEVDERDHSIASWLRWDEEWRDFVLVVANFTPVDRPAWPVPAPFAGRCRCLLDSDAAAFGGLGRDPVDRVETRPEPHLGREQRLVVDLPGLTMRVFRRDPGQARGSRPRNPARRR
ncbi:MAG: alpha amylase C-terminal domain-containing protein, partial [Longimicrobiales bacterium]